MLVVYIYISCFVPFFFDCRLFIALRVYLPTYAPLRALISNLFAFLFLWRTLQKQNKGYNMLIFNCCALHTSYRLPGGGIFGHNRVVHFLFPKFFKKNEKLRPNNLVVSDKVCNFAFPNCIYLNYLIELYTAVVVRCWRFFFIYVRVCA